jgi:hypothetical protein
LKEHKLGYDAGQYVQGVFKTNLKIFRPCDLGLTSPSSGSNSNCKPRAIYISPFFLSDSSQQQVFIDGISQLESPKSIKKPAEFQVLPRVPNFDKERKDAIKYEGLRPLRPSKKAKSAIFFNVRAVYEQDRVTRKLVSKQMSQDTAPEMVVVHNGEIICQGVEAQCSEYQKQHSTFETIDIEGGVIAPGFLSYGGSIGLTEIEAESSTNDGVAFAPFKEKVPEIIGNEPLMRAADGLQFNGRDTL